MAFFQPHKHTHDCAHAQTHPHTHARTHKHHPSPKQKQTILTIAHQNERERLFRAINIILPNNSNPFFFWSLIWFACHQLLQFFLSFVFLANRLIWQHCRTNDCIVDQSSKISARCTKTPLRGMMQRPGTYSINMVGRKESHDYNCQGSKLVATVIIEVAQCWVICV